MRSCQSAPGQRHLLVIYLLQGCILAVKRLLCVSYCFARLSYTFPVHHPVSWQQAVGFLLLNPRATFGDRKSRYRLPIFFFIRRWCASHLRMPTSVTDPGMSHLHGKFSKVLFLSVADFLCSFICSHSACLVSRAIITLRAFGTLSEAHHMLCFRQRCFLGSPETLGVSYIFQMGWKKISTIDSIVVHKLSSGKWDFGINNPTRPGGFKYEQSSW